MIDSYFTVKEIADLWELKPRTVQIMCANGKIPDAVKFGRNWAIPKNFVRPVDKRIVSGDYIAYRKTTVNEAKKGES